MDDFRRSSPITSRILPEVERERPLLRPWVEQMVTLCQPDDVVWCDGSQQEYDRLCQLLVRQGTLRPLNPEKRPNCYLALSDPSEWLGSKTEHSYAVSAGTTRDRPTIGSILSP